MGALVAVLTLDLMLLYGPAAPSAALAAGERPFPVSGTAPPSLAADVTQQAPPVVAPLGELREPNLFVVTREPFTMAQLRRVARQSGVRALELADAATVTIDGRRVQTLGVDPSSFRAYTPRVTAASDVLWRTVAAGDLAVSFVLGTDGGLGLRREVQGPGGRLRVGAYATTGLGAVDALVSKRTARGLGLPRDNALVVSAPATDSGELRRRLLRTLPAGTQIATVNPVAPPATAVADTPPVSAPQLRTALQAAYGKLGRPYVWGAEGPDSFDCSGLVQWAFAQAGIKLPRVTHQQWAAGFQVPLAQAQPGDLLFWRYDPTNPEYISHVAIYWGNGQMLHAPRTGDVVKLAPVTTRDLAGVVRINPAVAAQVR